MKIVPSHVVRFAASSIEKLLVRLDNETFPSQQHSLAPWINVVRRVEEVCGTHDAQARARALALCGGRRCPPAGKVARETVATAAHAVVAGMLAAHSMVPLAFAHPFHIMPLS